MDLSGVIWVATANDPALIPPPIRSRMIEVEISPPTPEQSRNIVKAIYRELLETNAWGKHFDIELDDRVINELAGRPPRLMKLELSNALANAASRSQAKERPIRLYMSDIESDKTDKREQQRGIGFLASI